MEVFKMNNASADIIAAVKQFRELYKQIALLLQTADEHMVSRGWEERGSQCVSGSNALKNPREWVPTLIFRMYNGRGNRKNVVAFVSVILSDIPYEADGPVKEPLVSSGWFEYEVGRKAEKGVDGYGWTSCHLEIPNRRDDGRVITTSDKRWLEPERWSVVRFSSLAVPLVKIQNSDDLLQRVMKPVLDHVGSLRPSK
jgi:hypothetical protein